jgi:succinoglycan biosynthesis protein ExoV
VKLFYYKDPSGNFGDDLNAWLWPRLIPELLDDRDDTLFVGIGSILDRRIPQEPRKIVFGTGVGYGLLPMLDETWQICCVRGPLTAKALGLPAEVAITDPAALVRTVRTPPEIKKHKVSFMPHFRTPAHAAATGANLAGICASLGIHYIDPCGEVEDVIDSIENSHKVITEAMHGAIVADALRVPWVPVQLSQRILNLKWIDWCTSLHLKYSPLRYAEVLTAHHDTEEAEIEIAHVLEEAATHAEPMLSASSILDEATARLTGKLDVLKKRHDVGCVLGSAQFEPDPEVLYEVPWLYSMQMALKELSEEIPPGATFIIVDEERWGGGQVLAGRRTLPFLERNGRYWGLPADGDVAISEIERLREGGAQYIAFMEPSFWLLDFYPGLREHLDRYRPVIRSTRVLVFDLRTQHPN